MDKDEDLWPPLFPEIANPIHQESKDESSDKTSEVSTISLASSAANMKKQKKQPKKVDKMFRCSHCEHGTTDWLEFENHNKIMHRVPAIFGCAIKDCFRFFLSKNGLKGHCSREHKDVLSCSLCDHVALGPSLLKQHCSGHDYKKFKCSFCAKGFGSNFDSHRHKVKCLQNPNRAITCKKCFEQGSTVDVAGAESGLVQHLQQEHNLKGEWLCIYCHKLYVSEKRFDSHVEKCKKLRGKAKTVSSTEDDTETDSRN